MVISHRDDGTLDHHTRSAGDRAGVGAVVGIGHVIIGQGTRTVVVDRTGPVIDISALNARVACSILESDMIHVDTAVNHAHNHTAAVIT